MAFFRSGKGDGYHPEIPKLVEQLEKRQIGRRDFLRTATLLGMTATTAYAIAGKVAGGDMIGAATAQTPKKGGTLRIGARVPATETPFTFSWVYDSNIVRQANDYLTRTKGDGITVPILLESWEPSEDLKSWTLNVKKGVKWSNDEDLVAEHVIWNLQQWLDPNVGSSTLGLFQGFILKEVDTGEKDEQGNPKMTTELWDSNAIEKVDDHTIRLNGQVSTLAIPENLFHYPAFILHPKDGGKWGPGAIGTGAFEPVEIEVGKRAVLKARSNYWGDGPHLDEVHFIDLGDDPATKLAALSSKQVDGLYDADIKIYPAVQKLPHIELHKINTAQTAVARMKPVKPFDDARVRKAMRLAIDTDAVAKIAYGELGTAAQHHHISPVHVEFNDMPMPRDLEAAKKLLADAGYPDGIDVELHAKKDPDWEPTACQAMVQQWAEAGIRVKLNVLPSAQFWDVWTQVPFGFTVWTHRPLGIMVMGLAYRTGVPWNESDYSNPKFDELLTKAEGLVDIEARRAVVKELQHIMQEEGPIVQPLWRQSYQPFDKQLMGYQAHPTEYYFCEHMWWDK